NIPVGTSGVLQGGTDTTAAQAQLDSLIERWKSEGTNAVFISGLASVSKIHVQAIKKAMPDALLLTDGDSSAKGAGQDAVNNKVNTPLVGSSAGTLHTDKYDANDAYALVAFDPTAGTSGDWKQLTPIQNVGGNG